MKTRKIKFFATKVRNRPTKVEFYTKDNKKIAFKARETVHVKLEKNPINALIAEMYDKLAAKMVVALYKEKLQIIKQLKGKL